MGFTKVGLSETILQGVYATGYSRPTEIQARAIPVVVEGRDLIGCAPTGTGKTAAFVLPILHLLQKTPSAGRRGRPRALILTPTRELAAQIEEAIREYGTYCSLRPLCIYGGVDINRQLRGLQQGADIVVATPGRLIDHLDRRSIDLSRVEILVLDEADRMLDMGFVRDVRKIIARVPTKRQTLLFSATISSEIQALAKGVLHEPLLIEIGTPFTPVNTVAQEFYTISPNVKSDLLVRVLQNEDVETALVFSRTKHGADRITRKLHRHGIEAEAIHSNRTQSQRQKTLDGFKRRRFKVLVATDVAARGIDVEGISHVVNFDIPRFAEDYIHRIGRTGRAEHRGNALTFVSADEQKYLRKIEQMVGSRCVLKVYPGFAGDIPPTPPVTVNRVGAAANFTKRFRFFGRRPSVPSHR